MEEEKKKKKAPAKRTVKKKVIKEEKKETVLKKEKPTYSTCQVLFIMVITLIFGLLLGKAIGNKVTKEKTSPKETNQFDRVYNDIVDNYYGEIDKSKLESAAICAMVNSLDDQYSFCLDEQSGNSLEEELEGSFVGLGVTITDTGNNKVTVLSVYENSPAAKAGIKENDILLTMDGVELLGENISSIADEIKSSSIGSKKVFKVLRNDAELELEVTLDKVDIPTVYSYVDERGKAKIGVIYLLRFSSATYDQFVSEYESLKEKGVNSLVIDVRNNTGGVLSSAVNISSLFLDKDMVIYQKSNGKDSEKVLNENKKVIDMPTAIVVNENTSSSAEVFASSLLENLDTPIVGTKTYGKGSIQKFSRLESGIYVKYTVQEWLTPKGNKINGVGIEPTNEVALYEGGSDVQLEKAFSLVEAMVNKNE